MDVLVPVLIWWLALAVIGAAALPIVTWLFQSLPDRGAAFARPVGLLLAGFAYWMAVMARVLPNSAAGAWVTIGALVAVGAVVAWRHEDDLRDFVRRRAALLVGYEWLFFVGFAGWALYRAFTPTIEPAGGEKYMEMAFINGVVGSPQFPPLDPWLSGFAISYYHFGYLQAGLLVQATGLPSSVAFNLIVPMTMGMTLVGAFGLGYNLVGLSDRATRATQVVTGAFAALLLPLVGSLEGAVELGFLRGWGPERLYQWLDIKDLTPEPGTCGDGGGGFGAGALVPIRDVAGGLVPTRHIWWWRGSRVIHDNCGEVIHEFPFFSFMLGDVHPHVVALPYVLTVLGVALMVLAGGLRRAEDRLPWSPRRLLIALVVGGLGFMNTWDLPTFGGMVVLAYAFQAFAGSVPRVEARPTLVDAGAAIGAVAGVTLVARRVVPLVLSALRHVPPESQPQSAQLLLTLAIALVGAALVYFVWARAVAGDALARRLVDVGRFTVWLAGIAVLLYLPFYLGFSSQAGGIGTVAVRSRLPQWLVHFGLMLFLAASLVVVLWARAWRRRKLSPASWLILACAVPLLCAAVVLSAWTAVLIAVVGAAAGVLSLELWRQGVDARTHAMPRTVDSMDDGAATPDDLAAEDPVAEDDELTGPEDHGVEGAVEPADHSAEGRDIAARIGPPPDLPVGAAFAVLCVAVGLLLPLATEFVFLRDLFGSRMNTIFKLYYQAWTLLAVGGAYAAFVVWRRLPRAGALLWAVPAAVLVLASLAYPAAAVYTRTNGLSASDLTLDGLAAWEDRHPDDLAAVRWLRDNAGSGSVLLEAYGGGYEHNGRISMATGLPAVLGWEGHEHQWRGTREEIDPRKVDIERMYKTTDEAEAEMLFDRYDVRYVVVSDAERAKFSLEARDEERLGRLLTPVYQSPSGRLVIYERQ